MILGIYSLFASLLVEELLAAEQERSFSLLLLPLLVFPDN
jgi:hypothetical protein